MLKPAASSLAARIESVIERYPSKTAAAEAAGVTLQTLRSLTSGKNEPRLGTIARLAEGVRVRLGWIWDGREPELDETVPPSRADLSHEQRVALGMRVQEAIRRVYAGAEREPNADDLLAAAMHATDLIVRALSSPELTDVELAELAERAAAMHRDALHLASAPTVARTRLRPRRHAGGE